MLEEVEERTYWALLESGMDSYDLDLTPAQRKEISIKKHRHLTKI